MSVRKPIHVLVLTATAARARRIGRVLREHYPGVVLHGPFATVAEAAYPSALLDSAAML